MITTGKKIRLIRIWMKMGQSELAKRIGISQPTLSQIESGWGEPTDEVLEKIEETLGIKLNDPRVEAFATIKPFDSIGIAA